MAMWEWEVEDLVPWNGLFYSFQNAYGILVTIESFDNIIALKRNTSFSKKRKRIELKKILVVQNEHLD